eukprot:2722530-Pleurochrysis_carterae.AAC.1
MERRDGAEHGKRRKTNNVGIIRSKKRKKFKVSEKQRESGKGRNESTERRSEAKGTKGAGKTGINAANESETFRSARAKQPTRMLTTQSQRA